MTQLIVDESLRVGSICLMVPNFPFLFAHLGLSCLVAYGIVSSLVSTMWGSGGFY